MYTIELKWSMVDEIVTADVILPPISSFLTAQHPCVKWWKTKSVDAV